MERDEIVRLWNGVNSNYVHTHLSWNIYLRLGVFYLYTNLPTLPSTAIAVVDHRRRRHTTAGHPAVTTTTTCTQGRRIKFKRRKPDGFSCGAMMLIFLPAALMYVICRFTCSPASVTAASVFPLDKQNTETHWDRRHHRSCCWAPSLVLEIWLELENSF